MTRRLLADPPPNAGGAVSPALLRRRLLAWYRREARTLPWRGTSDPYRVWVSEIMLQQTQVATAIPFYQRFIGRFPTLVSLASAREPEVLALWSGLGYYARPRRLLQAARIVARDHAGRIPNDPEIFAMLPGVGRYTLGAVLSIAYGRPLPVVDGNVARVLARLFARDISVREPRGARELWSLAAALVPKRGAGEWNQALMELGATVCVPNAPDCDRCPVRSACVAFATGRVAEFPPSPPKRATVRVRRALVLIERDGRVLMARRHGALLAGLWEPPGVDLDGDRDGDSTERRLARELARHGLRATRLERSPWRVRHAITHRRIEVEVWRGVLESSRRASASKATRPVAASPALRYVDPAAPRVAITGLARKIARAVAADREPAAR